MTSTFRDRVRAAFHLANARERGEITQTVLATRVAKLFGAEFGQPDAQRWLSGAEPREQALRIALARALGVDPGWLFFGEASQAPAPSGWEQPAGTVKVEHRRGGQTPEEFEREYNARQQKGKKKGA